MALVDAREKEYKCSVNTRYHTYRFGPTEKPKVLDLFCIEDEFLKNGKRGVYSIYGTTIWKLVNGTKVHKGFYFALQDLINRYDNVLVKLTREEEDFYKGAHPEVYETYVTYHKGQKFVHEIKEEKERLKKEEEKKQKK